MYVRMYVRTDEHLRPALLGQLSQSRPKNKCDIFQITVYMYSDAHFITHVDGQWLG